MENKDISEAFSKLSTPLITDACVRVQVPFCIAPLDICSLLSGSKVAGRVLPVKHYGSVDIFLEAMGNAETGDILIIDNDSRKHEGCIGDLTVLEARAIGLGGIMVWGCHRDTPELIQIGLPVFSLGSCPVGPKQSYPRGSEALIAARFGDFKVGRNDVVCGDDDGVVFFPWQHVKDVFATANTIQETERHQAEEIKAGKTLRQQLKFDDYLKKRSKDSNYTFRKHLQEIGGAIEV
jgi:4-hydroxy-4-methyl-2-oxoglutarate aldolase